MLNIKKLDDDYKDLLKLAKRSGWRIPGRDDPMPRSAWVSFWKQMITYEMDPSQGRPVVPHRSGGCALP